MHCAPEMKHQLVGINYKVDIWCLGIILYELYKNSHPFEADSPKEVINKVNDGIEEAKIGDTAIDKIILGWLNVNSKQRFTLARIKLLLEKQFKQDNVEIDDQDNIRHSYGLSSPNFNPRMSEDDNGTEKLDQSSVQEDSKNNQNHSQSNSKFYKVLK